MNRRRRRKKTTKLYKNIEVYRNNGLEFLYHEENVKRIVLRGESAL